MNKFLRTILACLVLALALVPSGAARAQDQGTQIRITQVDNSNFPQVTVYVSVTDAAGEPQPVDPSQIEIYENGKLMTPDQVSGSGEIGPLTTLLVIDISGSMKFDGKIEAAKAAADTYIDQMRPSDRAGVLAFNTQVSNSQAITADHQALKQAVAGLNPKGNTAMFDALVQGAQSLQSFPGRKAIIVLTDGIDNASQHTADEVILAIGAGGLSISTVGFGNPLQSSGVSGLDEAALRSLAERAGGIYGYANDPATLRSLYEHFGRTLQSEYKITYTSPLTLRDGLNRTLTVSLIGSTSTQARYNPGGVLPEVSRQASWPAFGILIAILAGLLFVPGLVSRAAAAGGALGGKLFNRKPKPRIRLK